MSQSEIIGGSLIAAFVVYLAMKGRLSVYWSLLMGGTAQSATQYTPSGLPSNPATPVNPGAYAPWLSSQKPPAAGPASTAPGGGGGYLVPPIGPFPGITKNPLYGTPLAPWWNDTPPSSNPGSQPAGP
jgi:hypothetical protein